ncbi:RNA polymerase, sigma-24 subunit, ECF subfamily [Pseudodesulfovibrio mercurii]|uniref:RNA polymerase, sigma-24 subunit, ECF subfamily n=1 Tax=Pseudodesulfovibrio mercurii TaxID=641491 RepID=F0JEI2_9BACT|nr:sigma-70 family RNA polymerase sigma factor [Pseudodesulfovibrio mercurii]EGB14711.1 RNA polymerase, sigma-24 subunit, ECF subfamily [Pseudodesulfovibrio mercurii]
MPDRSQSQLPDEALLEASGNGDRQAFGELVRRHQSWAWGVAYRFLGSKDEAEDIVQAAFIKLLAASHRYRRTARFKTFFHVIISRLCLDHAKKKKPGPSDDYLELADPSPGQEEALMASQDATRVRLALDTLPPKQRMALVLRYYEGLGYDEMATVLETSRKGVERLLSRGREALRTELASR